MPIYEYRCSSCGFQKEYLQKINDPVMSVCPECGKAAFSKMLSAAGFQLKGSGWYATDFKNSGSKPAAKADAKDSSAVKSEKKDSTEKKDSAEKKDSGSSKPDGNTQSKSEAAA